MRKLLLCLVAIIAIFCFISCNQDVETKTYTVTFNANGADSGTAPSAIQVQEGKSFTIPSQGTLLKSGYDFVDWNTKSDGSGRSYNESQSIKVDSDITLYAQWSVHTYSISYDLDGGSYPVGRSNPNSYTIETETFVLDNPEKSGYEFLGWATPENKEPNSVTIGKGTIGDFSFLAIWRSLNSYSISYDLNGGEGSIETTRKSEGESVEITSDSGISRKGYEFVCWNTSSDGSGTNYKTGDSYSEDADIRLYAQWEVVKYSISYDLAGGAMPDGKSNPLEYTIESDTFTLVNPKRKGYVFEGWKEKDSSDKTAVDNLSIERGSFGNKSFTAVWRSASKYTVTFDANGADGGTAPPELIVYEGTSFTVPSYGSLYKDGYVFNGWNTKADGTGTTYVESESVEVRDDIVLYAIWKDGPFEFSYLPDSDSYSVVCKDEGVSAVIIPSEYKGKPVTHIGNRAFFGFSELNSVTISENITSIGDCAFVYCSSLTRLEIPQCVTNIGNDVFSCCSGLRSINVNSENTVYYSEGNCLIERDTRKLILGCMNSVIPEDVTSIDSNAFYGCSGLTEITIPESVTSIGFYAFSDCSGLTGSLVIPEGVTSIEQGAFYGCSGLTSITIPESVKRIGYDVFSGCTGVKSVVLNSYVCMKRSLYSLFPSSYKTIRSVVMPLDVNSIGPNAFSYCAGLTELTIPESVTSIGNSAFYGCSGLTSITIPESVTSIGDSAFYGCSGLTSITIPESVTSIENWTFHGCTSIKSVAVNSYICSRGMSDVFPDSYKVIESVTIPKDVASIGDSVFNNCRGLESITMDSENTVYYSDGDCLIERETKKLVLGCLNSVIPEDVTSIGPNAFYGRSGLTSITIPESVTSIGDSAFYGCSGLRSVVVNSYICSSRMSEVFPDSYKVIESVTIPKSVTSIGDHAFGGCSGLTSITIPESVTSIGSSAFMSCTGLRSVVVNSYICSSRMSEVFPDSYKVIESVTIPKSVTSIGDHAFGGCSGLTSITIPESVVSIGDSAFYNCCSSLESITVDSENTVYHSEGNCLIERDTNELVLGCMNSVIPEDVTSIGSGAFLGCSKLTSITIPEGVTSIGEAAFSGCSGLTIITIPKSIISMSRSIFANCGDLFVSFAEGLKRIPDNALRMYTWEAAGSISVEIPASVTSIGSSAFSGCKDVSIVFAEGTLEIPSSALKSASTVISVTIPSSVKSIEDYAFSCCAGLTEIAIPEGVISVGDHAFEDCIGLSGITIPSSITSIGSSVFDGCRGLKSIDVDFENTIYYSEGNCLIERDTRKLVLGCMNSVIPRGVTSIGDRAFLGCSGLTNIAIPEGVTSIGVNAFSLCSNLASITIPSSVTSIPLSEHAPGIESSAFSGCSGIKSVVVNSFICSHRMYDVFSGCSVIESVTITEGVTSIRNSAFYGCSGLTSITIPSSVTSIGSNVFGGCCSSLKSITVNSENTVYYSEGNCLIERDTKKLVLGCMDSVIPEDVTSIGPNAFSYCAGLTELTIPESVTSIGDSAFYGCSGLTSITIPESVTSIGDSAFYGCSGIKSVAVNSYICSRRMSKVFPDSYKVIESVTITEGVTRIGDSAFYRCSGLTSVTIPESVTSIEESAFFGCSGLTSIIIPSNVTSIGDDAFKICSGLTSVTIPSSVTIIGSQVFFDCSGLKDIVYLGTIAEWNSIQKANDWNYHTGNYTIHCTDGDISK